MMRITIDVPVSDVVEEVRFCCKVFDALPLSPEGSSVIELAVGPSVVLRVCDEKAHVPTAFDQKHYKKGHNTRMDLRVANVPDQVAIAIAAGARLLGQTSMMSDTGPIMYAEVLDPFGHLWTFSQDKTKPA
jgi:uncharacterized glyoxalase superfamily protein PhnB